MNEARILCDPWGKEQSLKLCWACQEWTVDKCFPECPLWSGCIPPTWVAVCMCGLQLYIIVQDQSEYNSIQSENTRWSPESSTLLARLCDMAPAVPGCPWTPLNPSLGHTIVMVLCAYPSRAFALLLIEIIITRNISCLVFPNKL